MDVKEYFKYKKKMTNNCKSCLECKLAYDVNPKNVTCQYYEVNYPDEAIKIVEDYKKAHPVITNKDMYIKVIKDAFGDCVEFCGCEEYDMPLAYCVYGECEKCQEFWNSEYDGK